MSTSPTSRDVLNRYTVKISKFCDGINPYSLDFESNRDPLPYNVHYCDVINYCVYKESSYTFNDFRAFKGTEAYRFYKSGWIQKVGCKKISIGWIVVAKVNHSQRLNAKPLHCWISVEDTGIILCGHCDCMAGLGEVCSHVCAVLWMLEAWHMQSEALQLSEISCTDVLAKWLVPSTKKVEMAKIKDIFQSPTMEEIVIGPLEPLDDNEIDELLRKMRLNNDCCPIMAHREPFSDRFIEEMQLSVQNLPFSSDETNLDVIDMFLVSFYDPEFESVDIDYLREISDNIYLTYTDDQISYIEHNTRGQSNCKLWYRFRAGRVTGSTFKKVCRTSVNNPAMSTIMSICFPEQQQFFSKFTEYGKKNESRALKDYEVLMKEGPEGHTNFKITNCGLVINNSFPHCGVSPDGVTNCDCCGRGCVEVKCPWHFRATNMTSYLRRKDCPLKKVDGKLVMKEDHEYYYQVQMEMFVLEVEFCDFVLWNKRKPHVTRVYKDIEFWDREYPKTTIFFKQVLLPELLACYYSRKKQNTRRK